MKNLINFVYLFERSAATTTLYSYYHAEKKEELGLFKTVSTARTIFPMPLGHNTHYEFPCNRRELNRLQHTRCHVRHVA